MSRGLGGGLSMILNHHLFLCAWWLAAVSVPSECFILFFLHVWWWQQVVHHPLFFVDRQETDVGVWIKQWLNHRPVFLF